MKYLTYIVLAVLLYLLLKYIPLISNKIFRKNREKTRFSKSYPIIEFVVWAAFGLWAVNRLFEDKFYFNILIYGIIAIVLIFAGFYVFRDFAAGLLLKTEFNLTENSNLRIGNLTGKILKISYLSLELENSSHEVMKIPYSKINGKKIMILSPSESVKKFDFEIKIEKGSTNILDVKEDIRQKILNSAWSSVLKMPDIVLKSESPENWDFTVYFFAQNETHAEHVKKMF